MYDTFRNDILKKTRNKKGNVLSKVWCSFFCIKNARKFGFEGKTPKVLNVI